MVCPRQTGVVNPTTEVCRTRQQGWQGKAGQGKEGREGEDIGKYWGRGSSGGGREINDGFLCMGCQTCIETYCCVAIQRGVEE